MGKDLKVILAKADYCYHCKQFLPIYEKTIELAKKQLPNAEFVIEEMDTRINSTAHENFKSKYSEDIYNKVQGYPTVILILEKDGKKTNTAIEHTAGELEASAKNFLNNVVNGYKTLKSEGSKTFVSVENQEGGYCCQVNKQDEEYKAKYIKYKSKYLSLLKSSKNIKL